MRIGGGFSMLRALWRMSSINLYPRISVSEVIHAGSVFLHPLGSLEEKLDLSDLVRGSVGSTSCRESDVEAPPFLVLNFGSCS